MKPTIVTRLMLLLMAAVAAIGIIDAARDAWDLVVLFAFLLLMSLVLLIRTTTRRPLMPIRADLYRWLVGRAAITGERTEHLADRAISAYRAGMVGDDDQDSSGDDGT
jgi:hypothetical protein